MRSALKRATEFAGQLFPARSQSTSPVPAPHPVRGAARGEDFEGVSLSRRTMVGTMIAAFAPAAGTAVVLPKVIGTAAAIAAPAAVVSTLPVRAAESPELLALGAEVEAKLQAYRAARRRGRSRPISGRRRRTTSC